MNPILGGSGVAFSEMGDSQDLSPGVAEKRRTSEVRAWFYPVEGGLHCRWCAQVLRGGGTSNLWKHMRRWHSEVVNEGKELAAMQTEACHRLVARGSISLASLDDDDMRLLIPPHIGGRATTRRQMMELYLQYQRETCDLIAGAEGCVLMWDGWTSPVGLKYIGIGITGCTTNGQFTRLLSLYPLTAESPPQETILRNEVAKYVDNVDLFFDTIVVAYVTDGGSAERATGQRISPREWVHCCAHCFNLVIQDVFPLAPGKTPEYPVRGVLLTAQDRLMWHEMWRFSHRCHKIIVACRRTDAVAREFTRPPIPCATRWMTTLLALEWIAENVSLLQDHGYGTNLDRMLLKDISNMGEQLRLTAVKLQRQYGSMRYLPRIIDFFSSGDGFITVETTTSLGLWLKQMIIKRVKIRFAQYVDHPVVQLAQVFDKYSDAELPHGVAAQIVWASPISSTPASFTSFRSGLCRAREDQEWYATRAHTRGVFRRYMDRPSDFAAFARIYATIPASSAWIERVFSFCRKVMKSGPHSSIEWLQCCVHLTAAAWERRPARPGINAHRRRCSDIGSPTQESTDPTTSPQASQTPSAR